MASTTFVDRETLIEASWLNDVNAVVYTPGTQTAADIANVPAGSIAATDVQAALNELDTEKQPLDSTLTAISDETIGSFSHRNKIINGKMEIAQRGTSFAPTPGYTLDRWVVNTNGGGGVVTVSQQADAPANNEFQNSLRATVTTADTSIAAGDFGQIIQPIEGFNVRDLIGRTFTLSFWVRSSKTGIHCVRFGNSAGDRSYVAEYTINAANTWEFKTVTVSGGLITAGTWNWTNGSGLDVRFALATGSTFQTTAGSWQTGNFLATANQVNVLDTIDNVFAITGVQLEVGSVATPFEQRPIGTELALCQRYARVMRVSVGFSAAASNSVGSCTVSYAMRAAPTVTAISTALATNVANHLYEDISETGLRTTVVATAAGDTYSVRDVLLTVEL